jgi:glycosyltransferase involved in cell wall biosynthesis
VSEHESWVELVRAVKSKCILRGCHRACTSQGQRGGCTGKISLCKGVESSLKHPVVNHYERRATDSDESRRVNATFFMEQHLGHRVYYQNLRAFIDRSAQIRPTWVPITYTGVKNLIERFPFLPGNVRGSLICRRQVQQGLKRGISDVLYFNTQVPAALGNLHVKDKPYLIATDITPIQYDRLAAPYRHHVDSNYFLGWFKHHVNTKVFQGAAWVLPWSSWAAESLIQDYGVDPRRVQVLPVGIDVERWRPAEHANQKPVRILFVGGDFERKGGALLLEAFRSLPAGSAELILVTHATLPEEKGVVVHNNIQPNSAELLDFYQSSDIFVLPSNAEAFGIAAVEASASGLPVIATFSGGLPDIVVHQETGFLIPVGDVRSLSTYLRTLVENTELRKRMGRAAYRRAQIKFDARKNADRLVEILCETVSERGNG